MKQIIALILLFAIAFCSCIDDKNKNGIQSAQHEIDTVPSDIYCEINNFDSIEGMNDDERDKENADQYKLEEKAPFLITRKSVGFFTKNDTIGNLAKWYGWETSFSEVYSDGCLMPILQMMGLDIGLKYVCENLDETRKQDTTKLIFVDSPNCRGYYSKDTISWFSVSSDKFKTKEGIGVGSTFMQIQETYTITNVSYGSDQDFRCNNYVETKEYPGIRFKFICEDVNHDVDSIDGSICGDPKDIGVHFKPEAKVFLVVF